MPRLNEEQALELLKTLFVTKETSKSATAMRDRLIEIAGDRIKLVKLVDAAQVLK